MRGFRCSLFLAGLLSVLWSAAPAAGGPSWAADPVYVYYPRGDCRGEQLELQVWDRGDSAWRRHPAHARIALESCQLEDAGYLFNEIRSRCIERGSDPPPTWVVGIDVFDPDVMETCAPRQLAMPVGDLQLHVVAPAPGERVAAPEMEVAIEGSVRMDGIDGTDYDLELVIDRSSGTREGGLDLLAAQLQAAGTLIERLAPRLGAVRIGIASYPNMPPLPGTSVTGVRRVVPLTDDRAALLRGLREIQARGASGFQTFGSAFDFALAELEGGNRGSGARPRARKVLVIGANASGDGPFGQAAARDPRSLQHLDERLAHTRARHIALHLYALGGLSEELPAEMQQIFEGAEARFHRVLRPDFATGFFARVPLPVVARVEVANRTTGGGETLAQVTPSGRFATSVVASAGVNRLWARATLSDGATTEREWAFEFDDSIVRERLLMAEREHMRRVRAKRLELHPLWGELLPPEERDEAAPPAQ